MVECEFHFCASQNIFISSLRFFKTTTCTYKEKVHSSPCSLFIHIKLLNTITLEWLAKQKMAIELLTFLK